MLLCFVFIDPVLVTFTWLSCQKSVVRKEVDRRIVAGVDLNDLVLLKFSIEEARTILQWENSREFEYNHQMYDVVEKMILGDIVHFWCWVDHEETDLNRRMEKLSAREIGKNQRIREKQERVISFLESWYCRYSVHWKGEFPDSLAMPIPLALNFYSSRAVQPPTPPPKSI
jgi:hypothetical protein